MLARTTESKSESGPSVQQELTKSMTNVLVTVDLFLSAAAMVGLRRESRRRVARQATADAVRSRTTHRAPLAARQRVIRLVALGAARHWRVGG